MEDCCGSQIVVRPVSSRRQRHDFLAFPGTLYRGDPCWVPRLRGEQRELAGYRAHPFYERNAIQTFVAYRDGEVCGRVAAIENRGHIEQFGERRGYFGFFECVDDRRVAARLLDAARQWLAQRDLRAMRGPADPAMDYGVGVLIDGFDRPPTFQINYNPPYYAGLIEDYGFRKAQDLFCYDLPIDRVAAIRPTLQAAAARFYQRHRAGLRCLRKEHFLADVDEFLDVTNRSLGEHWGYVPMTAAEVRHMARSMRHLIVPDFALGVEVDGQAVAAMLAIHDYNPRIKRIGGRLFPFGFVRLLWNRRAIKRLRVISLSVLPRYQRAGVLPVLLAGLDSAVTRWGIRQIEFSWIAESNDLARTTLEGAGAVRTKTHRVYDLDP